MSKRILLAYGTVAGSTAEVAEAVAKVIEQSGILVDLLPVESVKDIAGYDAVIVGSAIRMFKPLKKTRRFLNKFRRELRKIPVAYFILCLTMGKETPENIRTAREYAKYMLKIKEPVSLGLFGGVIEHAKLSGLFGNIMKSVMEQDNRNWEAIRDWTRETLPKLIEIQ